MDMATWLGSRIREVRLARGLTQERLAEAADLSGAYVAQIEGGKALPSIPALARIAATLAVPVSGIISALDAPQEGETADLRAQATALLAGCDTAQLRVVLRMIAVIRAEWTCDGASQVAPAPLGTARPCAETPSEQGKTM